MKLILENPQSTNIPAKSNLKQMHANNTFRFYDLPFWYSASSDSIIFSTSYYASEVVAYFKSKELRE